MINVFMTADQLGVKKDGKVMMFSLSEADELGKALNDFQKLARALSNQEEVAHG